MSSSIRIESVLLTPGSRLGLAEPTASCYWSVDGPLEDGPALAQRLRMAAWNLRPSEPLHGISLDAWPQTFLTKDSLTEGVAAWGVALTVAILRLARDPVGQGRVVDVQGKLSQIALPFQRESIFSEAMRFALKHLLVWLWPQDHTEEQQRRLKENFDRWLITAQANGLSPNSLRFAMSARQRNIPVSVTANVVRLGWGINAESMDSSFTGRTGNIASRIAKQKTVTSLMLHAGGIPVASSGIASDWPQALKLAEQLGFPVVIKPPDQDQGLGVVPGILDEANLRRAFDVAVKFSTRTVIVEKHIDGDDHRMLVVGGQLLMATKRIPAGVTGDGIHTVTRLMEQINADPRRGTTKRSLLIELKLDDQAQACLEEQGLTADDVPDAGRFVKLCRTANISTGGTAVDVTTSVHRDNRRMAERCAQLVGLDIAGVDFICPDISRSWREVGGAVCEVNAQPGFRPHWLGDPERDINDEIIEWLFRGKSSRIPVIAIAQGEGSRASAVLLHRIWQQAGATVGLCVRGGVWIGPDQILERETPGFSDARLLLNEPTLEAAIIEMPMQMLIRQGHPCDHYDAVAVPSVMTDASNKRESPIGQQIESLRRANGAIVLDAESPDCSALLASAGPARQILVAVNPDSTSMRNHLAEGGSGVLLQSHRGEAWVVLAEGAEQLTLLPLAATSTRVDDDHAAARSSLFFAVALAWAQGISIDAIRRGIAAEPD